MNGSEKHRAKSRLDQIQIVEINRNNINQIWSQFTDSLKNADFIAVDLVNFKNSGKVKKLNFQELSGLGIGIHAKNIEQRYKNIREAAISRLAKEFSENLQNLVYFSEAFYRSVSRFSRRAKSTRRSGKLNSLRRSVRDKSTSKTF